MVKFELISPHIYKGNLVEYYDINAVDADKIYNMLLDVEPADINQGELVREVLLTFADGKAFGIIMRISDISLLTRVLEQYKN